MKKFYYLILFFLSFLCLPASAKIRLPHILCDNMVLQQQADARLWGWATPKNTRYHQTILGTKSHNHG